MIRIVLPWPNPKLAPNRAAGRDWRALAAIKREAKGMAYLLTVKALGGHHAGLGDARVPVSITFRAPDKRRRDLDSLLSSSKHALDGVAQALGVDDSCFKPLTLDLVPGTKPGAVMVEIGS